MTIPRLSSFTLNKVSEEIDKEFDADIMTAKEVGVVAKVMKIISDLQDRYGDVQV